MDEVYQGSYIGMPVQIELIRENTVVLQTYSEPLDSRQMIELRDQMDQVILPSAAGKMPIIADFSNIRNLPGTILTSGTSMIRKPHANSGQIIFVTSNAFVNAMAHTFARLSFKQSIKVVQSLEKAYQAVDALLSETG